MYLRKYLFTWLFFLLASPSFSQVPSTIFSKVEIRIDTMMFNTRDNLVVYNGENHLYFQFKSGNPICEIRVYPYRDDLFPRLHLVKSNDFTVMDSLVNYNDEYYRFKVKFRNLYNADFLNFTFSVASNDSMQFSTEVIPLLPVTSTNVEIIPDNNELFIGEEKVFPLITDNIHNIRIDNIWTSDNPINYRMSEEAGNLYLHLISSNYGFHRLDLSIKTKRPFLSEFGTLSYDIPLIHEEFIVRRSRLQFLKIDREYIIHDPLNQSGYEIQIENNPALDPGHTYRIENQEEPGGALIAELFVKSHINNGRMLCILRPYSLHRTNQGYLYIKDNDQSLFITNLNIIPKPQITNTTLFREGGDWTSNLSVYPGETIELRMEGESLQKASFEFEGLTNFTLDTLIHNDFVATYILKIPIDIYNRSIQIYNHGEKTGFELKVQEYRRPREFDYITIEGNGFKRQFNAVGSNILTPQVIQYLTLKFDNNKIDSDGELYGQQHLNIRVTLRGRNNELLEIKDFEDIVVCPGPFSPRDGFYRGTCSSNVINVNNYLNKKTYDIESWSKITVEISNDKNVYGGAGFKKTVEIIYEKYWRFDIEVSFPAGLITYGSESAGNLTGISMAMIAQFSFYQKNRINRLQPFKLGAGFLALDAFNFSENDDNRDLAIVILGSLYPTRKDKKLTFPLYFGGGYKLNAEEFFFLIGPGIRISL
jgi:hypothetical protein